MFSKQPKKSTRIWAIFVMKVCHQELSKLPNLVTLAVTDSSSYMIIITKGLNIFFSQKTVSLLTYGLGATVKKGSNPVRHF